MEKSFDQTDGILARALAVEDIEYEIMVQRALKRRYITVPRRCGSRTGNDERSTRQSD